jgi:GNAT superfamily N-acetyltransferase
MAAGGGVPVASGLVATDPFPPTRKLDVGDLKQCVALSLDRGWSPERSKWALLLGASEAFGIDAPDGRGLAGAVVLTRWEPDLASIGMMLVADRYGRRGLGRALMEHVIAEAGQATVTLFATDMGRPLYEQLGFQPVRRSVSFVGQFRAAPGDARAQTGSAARVRQATEADLPAILAVDLAAFGADRSRILTVFPGFAERLAVLETADGIAGYAAAWRNLPASAIIGPLVAPDPPAARRLIADLGARLHGDIRLDLDPDRPELPAWAHAHGLEPAARTTVMTLGDLPDRGTPDRLYTPISVALA